MEPRGLVWEAHEKTVMAQIPRDKPARVLHWVSESGDGKEYIYSKGEFYELPEGYWEGVGDVASSESRAVRALTVAEKEKIFKEPMQKLRRVTAEKVKSTQESVMRLEQKIGIEPSDEQKMKAIVSGKVPGYIVADTPLAKLLDKVGIRGGSESRFSSRFTLSSNINVMGQITDRFLDDLQDAVARKGTVHGAKQITTEDYELYTPVPGSTKTKYDKQYQMAKLLRGDTDDVDSAVIPSGLKKQRIYQMTTTVPEYPVESPVGFQKWVGVKMKQPSGTMPTLLQTKKHLKLREKVKERFRMSSDEPLVAPMGVKDVDSLEDVYPIQVGGRYTSGGERVLGMGEEAKRSVRTHISYRFVRDVLGYETKKGYGEHTGSFIDPEGTKIYQSMVNYESEFLFYKPELDAAIRRPTFRETGQSLFGDIDTSAVQATRFRKYKQGWINVYEIPIEGVKAAEGRVFRGKLTSIKDMIYFRKFVEVEKYTNPFELAKYQALLRAVRDEGIPLQKADKKILKMKPKFSAVGIAEKLIDDKMNELGVRYTAREWLDWDWKKMAEKDPTWKPRADELRKIEALQNSKRTVNSQISKLQTRRRELEEKLHVYYDKTAASEYNDFNVWYRLQKGYSRHTGSFKDREHLELQQIYKDLEGKYQHLENIENSIFGYYKDPTTSTGNYVHTLLRDVQPAPIREKGELGKPTGKILGYEETPFTGFDKDTPLGTGKLGSPVKSKVEEYHDWLTSDARTGVYTRNHPAVKAGTAHIGDRIVVRTRAKQIVTTEDTAKGRRFKPEKEQKGLQYTKEDEAYKVTTTYDPEYRTKGVEPKDVYALGEINLGDEINPNIISRAHVRALQSAILKKRLNKDGVNNTKKNIEQYQKELKELEEKDISFSDTTAGRVRKRQYDSDLESTKRSLQRELNILGTHRNIESKSTDYTPVDISDIERGTYTVEKGKNVQATVLAETEQMHAGAPAVRPLRYPPTIAGDTGEPITPRGVGSMYPATEPIIPEATAVLEQKSDVEVKALVPTIKPRSEQVGDILGAGTWLRDSSKMISSAAIDLTTKEDAKNIFPHIQPVGTILFTKERGLILEKQVTAPRLRIPEPLQQRVRPEEPKFLARVVRPPRIRPVPPVVFGWLDPAERAKRQAKLKKKKKKKIAWAAPKRWFEGEGYYFKGGAAYTSFTRREPRKVKRLDVRLGEQKWSESRTRSLFDVRPFKGRKINPYRDRPRKKVKKKQPKRSDIFGSTSTQRKGY